MFSMTFGEGSTPFSYIDRKYDKLFGGIGFHTEVDSVCPSVIRALLMNRVEGNSHFNYSDVRKNMRYSDNIIINNSEYFTGENMIQFTGLTSYTKELMDLVVEKLSACENFTEIKRVREFFKSVDTVCFIDTKNRYSLVVYDGRNIANQRCILQGIPAYLPWYFKDKPVDEDEMRLLKSLGKSSSDEFIEAINVIGDKYNISGEYLALAMEGFEAQYMRAKQADSERKISNYEDRIKRLMNEISDCSKAIRDEQWFLVGCKQAQQGVVSQGLDYLKHSDNIKFDKVSGNTAYIWCKGYLECYDEQMVEEFIDNEYSIIYEYSHFSSEVTKRLFKKIFIDKEVKIKVCAPYGVSLENMNVVGDSNRMTPPMLRGYLQNPHIYYYACLGDYATMMHESLRGGDLIGTFELCLMSTRSLNFADSTVMERFMSNVLTTSNDNKFFELADGTSTDVTGMIKLIKEEINNEQND